MQRKGGEAVILTALSIKTKLLLLILALLFPYLLFNLYSYIQLEEQIEMNAMLYGEQLVQQLNGRLDAYFSDLERSALPVITHPLVQEFMEIDPKQEPYRYAQLSKRINEEVVPSVIFDRPEIYGFFIVTEQGAKVGNFRGAPSGRFDLHQREPLPRSGFQMINIHALDSTPMITLARKFWSTPSYEHAGVLVFEVRVKHLTYYFSEIELGEQAVIYVTDERLRPLAGGALPEGTAELIRKELQAGRETGSMIQQAGSRKHMVAFHHSRETGITVAMETPLDAVTHELHQIPYMNIWVHLAFLLMIVLGVSAFSFSITRSVAHLQRLMKKAEEGDLEVRAPERRKDEIGRLNQSFNHMVAQIRRLIEVNHKTELREKERMIKEREAMLLAMQARIHPHFLYNTLEFINSYAILHEIMPISRMAAALGEMFRYSLEEQTIVTLQDELGHVQAYLEIQLERYPGLIIEQSVDPCDVGAVQAIRLTVQPLVENAFKHGYFKYGITPDFIGIKGEKSPAGYKVTITDRGRGMELKQIERYNRLFQQAPEEPVHRMPSSDQGIGLMNVHQRIRMTFGEPYGLHIVPSAEGGTAIEMILPYEGRVADVYGDDRRG